jgi:uncharacterized protein YjbJ (UPF0337 family)
MTTTDPDQIRRQIEGTRRDLSADVNALTEKVSPSRMVSDRVDRARGAMTRMKDRIMGTAESATATMQDTASGAAGTVSSAASSTADAVASAPDAVRRQTEGNPLAAGLVAFGLGWLASSLVPSSRREQQLVRQAAPAGQAVGEKLQQAASEVAGGMREPARQAAESVKETAGDAASTVAGESRVAAGHVSDRAGDAKDAVQQRATS